MALFHLFLYFCWYSICVYGYFYYMSEKVSID